MRGRGLRSAGGGGSDAHGGWQAVLLLGSPWHADVGRDAVALAGRGVPVAGGLDAWRLEGELQVPFGLEEKKKERTLKGG